MKPRSPLHDLHLRLSATLCGNTYNLKLHSLALQLDGADLEVDTDGTNVALGVCVVGEPEQET